MYVLWTTKVWMANPLKLQNIFSFALPMFRLLKFTDAEDIKFTAIQKSLMASPLYLRLAFKQKLFLSWSGLLTK